MTNSNNAAFLGKVIFEKPEAFVKILEGRNVSLSPKVTLHEIVTATLIQLNSGDEIFAKQVESLLSDENYNNFEPVTTSIAVVSSLVSSIFASRQARKNRELQRNIAIAKLETDKLISQEELRLLGETERTKILANSLLAYRTALQGEATDRQKNVWVYIVAIGFGISIIYATTIIMNEK